MASENKKHKAKNSHLYSGADKLDGKLKRTMYFTKRQRQKGFKDYLKDDETLMEKLS